MFAQGEDFLPCPPPPKPIGMERRWKPNVELAPNCPRCHSSNTKFCYYNNYSLTQPRYFCKSCRRYWTKGGSLRNVPIGGGCRKKSRAKSVPVSAGTSRLGFQSNASFANSNGGQSTCTNHESSSTIDLALVYAKFLDSQPDPNPPMGMSGLPKEFQVPRSFESQLQFSDELVGCQATVSDPSPEDHQVLFNEFTGMDELQPLPPNDDIGIQDMFWSNSPAVGSNFSWQGTTQLQGFEPVVHDDHHHSSIHSNPLDDSWNSFDLPSFEAFSRP